MARGQDVRVKDKMEAADEAIRTKPLASVMITPQTPIKDIPRMIAEMFGHVTNKFQETDNPENKSFMEDACDFWMMQNNSDELKDPSLEIDYVMGLNKEIGET